MLTAVSSPFHPHPSASHIVRCLAVLELPPDFPGLIGGYVRPTAALVLELLEGGSLRSLMHKQLLAPWKFLYDNSTALTWSTQIASALAHLHGLSPPVMHRVRSGPAGPEQRSGSEVVQWEAEARERIGLGWRGGRKTGTRRAGGGLRVGAGLGEGVGQTPCICAAGRLLGRGRARRGGVRCPSDLRRTMYLAIASFARRRPTGRGLIGNGYAMPPCRTSN